MTENRAAARPLALLLSPLVWLRDLAARHSPAFMALWLAGLIALAPLSLLPGTAPPTGISGMELSLDKVLHVIAYGGLAGIPMLALVDGRRRLWAVAIVLLTSLVYEIGQDFVPGRSFGFDDLAANLAGVALGVAAGWWLRSVPAVR